jgi:hypothetical protein
LVPLGYIVVDPTTVHEVSSAAGNRPHAAP